MAKVWRSLVSLGGGLLLTIGLVTLGPAPATAGSTTHCSGWSQCVAAGFSDAGYGAVNRTSFWRMFGGHNCTNYVAYRMIQAGMPDTRPFSGTGNAWNWGVQMASKTDAVPAVGAVAWWNKGVAGAGSVGHVAYVEQVVSPTEIVISEDSYSGTFHWRTITMGTSGSGWPSGFIHLVDRAPIVNSAPITITGTPAVGQTVGSTPGAWTPAATLSYQWFANGAPIPGATTPSLAIPAELGGTNLLMRVTATAAGYATAFADSAPVTVLLGALAPSGAPAVSGAGKDALVGTTLTATRPTFSPKPKAVKVQWLADGVPISGATGWSYQLSGNDVLKSVTAVATGRKPGYVSTPAASSAVGPVLAGTISTPEPFAIKGPAQVGKILKVASGTVAPADATASYTWRRDGEPIAGATASTYTVTEDDAGSQLSVVVAFARTGWLGMTTKLTRDAVVAGKPTFSVRTTGQSGRAVIWFRVQAPGSAKPSGTAVVTVGNVQRTVTVTQGIGKLTLAGLAPGKRKVTIVWRPTAGVLAGSVQDKVRVRK